MKTISARQFAIVMAVGYIALCLFEFPRVLVTYADRDAIWALLFLTLTFSGFLFLNLRIAQLRPHEPAGASLRYYLGLPGALVARSMRILAHTGLAVVCLANFGLVMKTFFLPQTPPLAIDIAVLAAAVSMAWGGAAGLARTVEIFALPAVVITTAIAILTGSEIRYPWAAIPPGQFHILWILSGSYHTLFLFVGLDIVTDLFPYVLPEQRPRAVRAAHWMFVGMGLWFMFGLLITIATTGPFAISHIVWPPVSAMRLADVRGFLINKLGLLIIVLWGLFVQGFMATRLWGLAQGLSWYQWTPKPAFRYHGGLIAFSAIILLISAQFPNVAVLEQFIENLAIPLFFIYMVTFPLLIGAGWLVRRWQSRRAAGAPTPS